MRTEELTDVKQLELCLIYVGAPQRCAVLSNILTYVAYHLLDLQLLILCIIIHLYNNFIKGNFFVHFVMSNSYCIQVEIYDS